MNHLYAYSLLTVTQENFFRNFGSILTFAFLGTFISAVGLGQVASLLGLANRPDTNSEQGARIHLVVPRSGISASHLIGVSNLRNNSVCHGPRNYPRYIQPVQSRPEALYDHLWRESVERCCQYRHVRVSSVVLNVCRNM